MPEHGKWTKFAPAVDWIYLVNAQSGILEKLISKMCAGAMDVQVRLPGGFSDTLKFHKVGRGERWAETQKVVSSTVFRPLYGMCCVILEKVRELTCFFLKASRDRPSECASFTLDWLNDSTSPTVRTLQYLRYVGSGRNDVGNFLGSCFFSDLGGIVFCKRHRVL